MRWNDQKIRWMAGRYSHRVRRPDLIEDIVQEIYLAEAQKPGAQKNLRHAAVDAIRKLIGRNRLDTQTEFDRRIDSIEELVELGMEPFSPDDLEEKISLQQELKKRIDQLVISRRLILHAHVVWGFSMAEIGQALDLSESRICQIANFKQFLENL